MMLNDVAENKYSEKRHTNCDWKNYKMLLKYGATNFEDVRCISLVSVFSRLKEESNWTIADCLVQEMPEPR